MLKHLLPLTLAAALGGCVTVPKANEDGSFEVRLGQKVDVGGPKVTPLRVLEDSRCPMEARCVWAGRVRLEVRVDGRLAELASDRPLPLANGSVELVNVMPPRSMQRRIEAGDYRFTLKFNPGR
ncbi:MAG: hypothetical protein U1E37_10875 [Sphingomonadaceae bacterium]